MTELQKKYKSITMVTGLEYVPEKIKKVCQLIFNYMIPTVLMPFKLDIEKQIHQLQSVSSAEQMFSGPRCLLCKLEALSEKSPPQEARQGCILTITFCIYFWKLHMCIQNIFVISTPNLLSPTPPRTPSPASS